MLNVHNSLFQGGTGLRPVVSGVSPETVGKRTIAPPLSMNQRSISPDEIRRDAEFNRRDACSTHQTSFVTVAKTSSIFTDAMHASNSSRVPLMSPPS